MKIELRSLPRKILFAVICCFFIALFFVLSLRAYLAARLAFDPTAGNLQRAIRLEPGNAEYRQLLGRNFAVSSTNLDAAIENYRSSVALNPYDARTWLDLAGAYQVAGRVDEQGDSVQHAVETDPTTPNVAWEAANFFLLQGDTQKALRNFGVVMANDPQMLDAAVQICWRATGDANEILSYTPRKPDAYLSFLRLLSTRQELLAAENVWSHLIALNEEFPPKLAFPFFRLLLAKQEVAAAQSAWRQEAEVNRSLQAYLPSSENLIVNGGFEENILNGGFDWWYQANPHASLSIDTTEFSEGSRSLSITFDGQNAAEAGISQFIPVKPNTNYQFSAQYRAEELDTASGPRFAVRDAYSDASYVLSDDILGTNPWRTEQAEFHTGPNTQLVVLKIVREPANALIRGKLWIDDLKLTEK